MKMSYFIISGIILAGGLIFYLTSCVNKSSRKETNNTISYDTTNVKITKTEDNPFEGLRNMAFEVTPDQLDISLPSNETIVFGVIMDWEINGEIATVVSYQSGDASLYLSSGGGVIGGGQHINVSNAAKEFVNLAQKYLNKSAKTEITPLPEKDKVLFYLLTNKGIYTGQESMENFENNSSLWLGLFEQGNKVLTELRLTSEN